MVIFQPSAEICYHLLDIHVASTVEPSYSNSSKIQHHYTGRNSGLQVSLLYRKMCFKCICYIRGFDCSYILSYTSTHAMPSGCYIGFIRDYSHVLSFTATHLYSSCIPTRPPSCIPYLHFILALIFSISSLETGTSFCCILHGELLCAVVLFNTLDLTKAGKDSVDQSQFLCGVEEG